MMSEGLRDTLQRLSEIDVTQLERKGKDITFEEVQKENEQLIDVCQFLYSNLELWERIPNQNRKRVYDLLHRYREILSTILHFNAQTQNPVDEKQNIVREIFDISHELFSILVMPITIWRLKSTVERGDLDSTLNEAKQIVEETKKYSEEAVVILERIKSASGEVGVSAFADVFKRQAEQHEELARNWLIAVIGFTFLMVGLTGFVFFQALDVSAYSENPYSFAGFLIVRIVAISLSALLFFQSVKQFNINSHLQALNKHRQNTLQTFQAFVDSSNDAQIRDAVLLQATKSIFDAGDTGYVRAQNEQSLNMETVKLSPSFPTKDS